MILDARIQGKGFGRQLLNMAKEKEAKLNAWVVDHDRNLKKNGEIYRSPLDFYLKNGFEKLAESRLESDKISAVKIHWKK